MIDTSDIQILQCPNCESLLYLYHCEPYQVRWCQGCDKLVVTEPHFESENIKKEHEWDFELHRAVDCLRQITPLDKLPGSVLQEVDELKQLYPTDNLEVDNGEEEAGDSRYNSPISNGSPVALFDSGGSNFYRPAGEGN